MKHAISLVGLLVCVVTNVIAQEFKGRVIDVLGSPIAFANVVLMSVKDSVFITGTVTDDAGVYQIKCSEPADNLTVKASCIGYQSFVSIYKDLVLGNIVLQDASTELDEVVIKANRPIFRMDAGTLTTTIQNTALSQLGDAIDVLAQLPFLSTGNGAPTVFGRGEPVIYINNNIVRNPDELSKLKSDQIKDIKIIMNPGAEYDATVKSVIKITTFRPVGEGLSGMIQGIARQRHNFSHFEAVSLNYRIGGLDIFAYGNNSLAQKKQKQDTQLQFPFQDESFDVKEDGKIKIKNKSWESEGGFNYAVNSDHSFGMKYTFDKDVKSPFRSNFDMNAARSANRDFQGITAQEVWQRGQKQYLNMYYQGQLTDKVLLHFDGDYVNGNLHDDKTTIVTDYLMSEEDDDVHSKSGTNYELYAGKLWMKSSLWNGELLVGVESSYTNNRQRFHMLSENMSDDIPSTNNKSEQTALAPFASYEKSWGGFTANVGLRYEYVNFKYFMNGLKQDDESRVYNNLFPTIALAYSHNSLFTSLSYRNTVERPYYNQLRSSISYNNPYTYEGGNPALRPSNQHSFNLMLSYKDFQFSADYMMYKDYVFFTMKPYQDKSVILFTSINHDVNLYNLYLSYAPTIFFWKPTFTAGLQGQQLSYVGRKYNSPIFTYSWRNMFQLPHDFMAVVNIEGNTCGNMQFSATKSDFQMDLSIRKLLINGHLQLTLGMQDALNTKRERWTIRIKEMSVSKWNNTDSRTVYFRAVYRFNSARSKYKGDNASNREINRL